MKRSWRRRLGWTALGVVVACAGAAGSAWWILRGSLAQLDGERALAGLAGTVTVERDALGVPTLRAETRLDLARAIGFVHAQDRFFQMDLLRRSAAGELSALIGPAALSMDRARRWHRLRARAVAAVARLRPEERALLDAYAAGVNAGREALRVRPFEYLALRTTPEPWRPEDSVLAAFAMFLDLQDASGRREFSNQAMRRALAPELAAFFLENGSAWSARLDGTTTPILPVPGPESFRHLAGADRAAAAAAAAGPALLPEREVALGSNNWAVRAERSTRGAGAIVASDMHLSLRNLPGTWYRARLVIESSGADRVDVCGVMLPGMPAMVVGSNGHVAWGFTNAAIDTADVVTVEFDPADPRRYRTPDGWRTLEEYDEVIAVHGGAAETLRVAETIWGPLLPDRGGPGRERHALAWIAHDPARVNLEFMHLDEAEDVGAALAIAARAWLPAQNIIVGDRAGHIGWTIAGPYPVRHGFDGSRPVSMADGSCSWETGDAAAARPGIVDPAEGVLWTANAQPAGGAAAAQLGDGGWSHDGRAWQIRERLRAAPAFDELSLFAIQGDTDVVFLQRWRDLAVGLLDDAALGGHPERAEFRRLLAEWSGRADIDSAGYTVLRRFRQEVAGRVLRRILAPCWAADPRFRVVDIPYEEPLWLLVSTQVPWTAAPGGWKGELLEAIDATIAGFTRSGETLAAQTWGRNNRLDMCHPFARFMPQLRGLLGVPAVALPGDSYAINAFTGDHGPSERMVVAPGREAAGILEIPGGQSGHPLSPYFRAGHDLWVRRVPAPFLPGSAEHQLTLSGAKR